MEYGICICICFMCLSRGNRVSGDISLHGTVTQGGFRFSCRLGIYGLVAQTNESSKRTGAIFSNQLHKLGFFLFLLQLAMRRDFVVCVVARFRVRVGDER